MLSLIQETLTEETEIMEHKKKVKPNTFKYIRLGYHNTLAEALNKLINHKTLSGEGELTAQELLSGLTELKQEILNKVGDLDLPKTA